MHDISVGRDLERKIIRDQVHRSHVTDCQWSYQRVGEANEKILAN